MRKWMMMFAVLLFVSGCAETKEPIKKEVLQQANEVKVIEKKEETHYRASSDYYVTVEKNGTKATFEVNEKTYNMIEKGSIISGQYNKDGLLQNIVFSSFK